LLRAFSPALAGLWVSFSGDWRSGAEAIEEIGVGGAI